MGSAKCSECGTTVRLAAGRQKRIGPHRDPLAGKGVPSQCAGSGRPPLAGGFTPRKRPAAAAPDASFTVTGPPAPGPGVVAVTSPGLIDGLPLDQYVADPVPGGSLSSSGARLLVRPGGPAKFRARTDQPRPASDAMELGTALHTRVLGVGPKHRVPCDASGKPYARWDSNAAKDAVAEIRGMGDIPLKAEAAARVDAMAEAILAHPDARSLIETPGRPEMSAFVQDDVTGVWMRARFDWLPETDGGSLLLWDLKSSHDASDDGAARSIGEYGYHQQAQWHSDVAHRLGLAERVALVFVMQEPTAPFLVNVVAPARDDIRRAELLNAHARHLYRQCRADDVWPGYSREIHAVAMKPWDIQREESVFEDE
jgi:hypothetical protein